MKTGSRIIVCLLFAIFSLAGSALAEQWKINFNSYPGIMELSGGPNNYAGRFNLHGSWEQMLDLRVYRNAIFFSRASADQKYLGVIEGGRMQGIFSHGGSGSYPWTAVRMDSQPVADPFASTPGYDPSSAPQGPVSNLALKKQARESSTGFGSAPGRAVDGNRDGNYSANSVTHTNNAPNEWWEVDLGSRKQLTEIKLWNRTDCCGERLSNLYVMVSDHPFSGSILQQSLNNPSIWKYHLTGPAGRETSIPVSVQGRYVRVQLAGQNWLSLAEVEVFGSEAAETMPPSIGNGAEGEGMPVTVFWHMADNADVYLNGRPLRNYSPSFKTRSDEAPQPAFSARTFLKDGDVFTVGGRRGGSFGLMLIAIDDSGRVVFRTDRESWAVYAPGERDDWFDPSAVAVSGKRPVTVQPNPWPPQKNLNSKYNNKALSIWSEPENRFAYLYGIVRLR